MIPQPNKIYRHFKGNIYRVITVAVHTETEEEMVIYQALYGEYKVYARPLSMFMSEVDHEKYPEVTQKMRFEPVEQIVDAVTMPTQNNNLETEDTKSKQTEEPIKKTSNTKAEPERTEKGRKDTTIDPLLEQYLDTDSYREKLNILHGLQHRITEHMLNIMAIVIDFELPEGDIQTMYDALNECLLTKEKYECNRIV